MINARNILFGALHMHTITSIRVVTCFADRKLLCKRTAAEMRML